MNDELNGQLAQTWTIPAYARDLLWVEGAGETVQAHGARGEFSLDVPSPVVTIRWGGENGPALTQLRWQVDALDWDGSVRVGGYVDALHVTEQIELPEPLTVLHVGGQPLKPDTQPYPTRARRKQAPYAVPGYFDGLAEDVDESVTTWMALSESPVLVLAQDALVNKLPVYCYGSLAEDDAGWHEAFALPIILEAMSIFAP
jgi:hypothetical protein